VEAFLTNARAYQFKYLVDKDDREIGLRPRKRALQAAMQAIGEYVMDSYDFIGFPS
jgi:hypothetical protein